MADLLVRLYALPPEPPPPAGVTIRRALAGERHVVAAFARQHGSAAWASECEVAFARLPLACFVAVQAAAVRPPSGYPTDAEALLGFACYEATARGFFGPTAVHPDHRRQGIGRALLLATLAAMRGEGHAYAIIGWASDPTYYQRAVGATVIADSEPGIYRPPLRG